MTIAILEDDQRRIDKMVRLLKRNYSTRPVELFNMASEMIAWLETHLAEAALISLDHDLELDSYRDGKWIDPGDGRDVANYLASRSPCCPVIVHSVNWMFAPSMVDALQESGWTHTRVSPYDDLKWIKEAWLPEVHRFLGEN
ncbi:MAG: hypothetical protein N2C14_26220 [Planctomycetales bacterium]